jgi:L-cysteine:1D-myo-inositol 2-amino-2-deoxy-alpha-D-glucopyranoside ligase
MRGWAGPAVPDLPGVGVPVRVFDTATGELRPLAPGPVARMYVCGITPYDSTHVGHAATYVAFDLLQRVLRDNGHAVRYVQNVTDVDDPLLERARVRGVDWAELAADGTQIFREDMTALRVLPPDHFVGAVEAIPEILDLVEVLRDRAAAYELDGDVYFSVAAAPRFGEVAHLPVDTMRRLSAERGGDPDRPGKKDPLDALLWQVERPGEPSWPSPFGPGRPGWHAECAAIALRYLGPAFDLQGGGTDLVFPHHELSAAQGTVASGEWPYARSFVHSGMVGLDGVKMSKSRGNLVFVRELRSSGHDPAAIRLALLAHHYRDDWDWTGDGMAEATSRLDCWRAAVDRSAGPDARPVLQHVRELLADDLRAPAALDAVDRWARAAVSGHGDDLSAPGLVRDLANGLLGVDLRW